MSLEGWLFLSLSGKMDAEEKEHTFRPLAVVREGIIESLKELLQPLSNMLAEIEKMEKKAWQKMDKLVENCKQMVDDLERWSKEQACESTKIFVTLDAQVVSAPSFC